MCKKKITDNTVETYIPKHTTELGDLLSDIEDSGMKIVSLMIDHDGMSDFYDSEDVEFVDPELYERIVHTYGIRKYAKQKVSLYITLE